MNRRRSLRIGSLALFAVLVSGGAAIRLIVRIDPPELKIGRAESMAYRDLLVGSLREEGTVTIIEHSWHGDRPNSGGTGELEEYRRIKLDPRLVAELARRLEAMDTDPQIAVMMCFSPHHSIEFSPATGEPSRMLVCFGCHRVEWDRSGEGVPPAALIGLLEQFFQELDPRLVAELARRLEAMDTDPQIAVMMCFSPHHSIEFSPAAGEPSRMLVCFGCHRVEWDLSEDGVPPAALIGLLEQFFQELGLRPRADWSGLAEPRAVNAIGRGSRMSQNEMVRNARNHRWVEKQRVPDVNAPSR